ncbi:M48 family metalloprotease [Yunchengibacter salinarum]|uniref:M48 family metalloprotease n=1 Tax=Yunchengibacter salinarum TaxID=3133399 RepID=UPI0035B68427
MRFRLSHIFLLLAALVWPWQTAHAQSLLRDAETESFLRDISNPIFEAAGLTPESVRIYIVNDQSLNAFVTGGQNVFLNSGLIMRVDNVNQLKGVIAHETCHIACGHSVTRRAAMGNMGLMSAVSMVLGAAAIALGGGDAGMGVMMAGQNAAQRNFLSHTRSEESTADQAALDYLNAVEASGEGLMAFLDTLRDQEVLANVRQDPYVRSHPIGRQRLLALQKRVESSDYYGDPPNRDHDRRLKRIQAKMVGYLKNPQATVNEYPPDRDQSVNAHYARAYAYHKALEWDWALEEANALIEAEPDNPFFHEIKGQILFEAGRIQDSLPVFREAVSLAPEEPLLIAALGQALVATDNTDHYKEATRVLRRATRLQPDNSFAWFQMARAYAALDKTALANLATAERYYSGGVAHMAARHAHRAMEELDKGTADWLRAQDIFLVTKDAAERSSRQQRRRR